MKHPGLIVLVLALILSVLWLIFLVRIAPVEESSQSTNLFFPSNLDDLHTLSNILGSYLDNHYPYVILLFSSAYLFKQTFAVPGSVLMNVLGGAVFGLPFGFTLCCILTAIGASLCYLLANICGKSLAAEYFPKKIEMFKTKLDSNQDRLVYFLLFLRLFPMSPNWAINMSCGVLNVPMSKFFFTVLIGLMPYNYLCVQTGALLTSISSVNEIFTLSTMIQMSGVALVVLLPGLFRRGVKWFWLLSKKPVWLW